MTVIFVQNHVKCIISYLKSTPHVFKGIICFIEGCCYKNILFSTSDFYFVLSLLTKHVIETTEITVILIFFVTVIILKKNDVVLQHYFFFIQIIYNSQKQVLISVHLIFIRSYTDMPTNERNLE